MYFGHELLYCSNPLKPYGSIELHLELDSFICELEFMQPINVIRPYTFNSVVK